MLHDTSGSQISLLHEAAASQISPLHDAAGSQSMILAKILPLHHGGGVKSPRCMMQRVVKSYRRIMQRGVKSYRRIIQRGVNLAGEANLAGGAKS